MNEFVCRICGFPLEEKPWGEDGEAPTYDICPCCGVEFGNEDYCLDSIREYRIRWINNGCQWFRPRECPVKWDCKEQMENIPKCFL